MEVSLRFSWSEECRQVIGTERLAQEPTGTRERGMAKIKTITLKNFKGADNVTIDISDRNSSPVITLIGLNECATSVTQLPFVEMSLNCKCATV